MTSSLSLSFTHVVDSGEYRCTCNNTAGWMEKSLQLLVREKPKIGSIKVKGKLVLGKNIELACLVTAGNPPPVVFWFKDGSLVTLNSSQNYRVVQYTDFSLSVRVVSNNDSGVYSCRIENVLGVDVADVNIVIIIPPLPPIQPIISQVSKTSINITWSAATVTPSTPVTSYTLQYMQYLSNLPPNKLWCHVTNLTSGSSYWLRVAGANEAGIGEYSSPIVAYTSANAPSEPRNLKVEEANSTAAKLTWEIPGEVSYGIQLYQVQFWIKYPAGQKYDVVEVVPRLSALQRVTLASLRSFTFYECRVRKIGADEIGNDPITEVLVRWAELIRTTNVDNNNNNNSNNKNSNNNTKTNYLNNFWNTREIKLTNISNFMNAYIGNLKPNTLYSIRIVFSNDAGYNSDCHSGDDDDNDNNNKNNNNNIIDADGDDNIGIELVIKTKPSAPTGAPINIQVFNVTSNSFATTWQGIALIDRNCDVTGHVVQWQGRDQGRSSTMQVALPLMNAITSQLVPNTTYVLMIRAYCIDGGFGPYSNPILVSTLLEDLHPYMQCGSGFSKKDFGFRVF
ncbi:hypothetical protein HELRODRAFT_180266 [Helobdella robusta]|uniref:Uncharacterized protein n=1 Tax=Helobdella robusta TaxID=6412 RepID=T1FFN3_HELRO|nr:hypothetical protein HELRODRAFT_180266 [Helobdella robusta]ESN94098.1 hypothetical protein HELRODRAFT_180266 [Helobdella robusta]